MQDKRYYYLIKFRFLGFRYHGWQKQPDTKTVQLMIEKTIKYVLGAVKFKTLGASRTDAMVSANQAAFELFSWAPVEMESFKEEMNINLPRDIEILSVEEVDEKFNVIQDSKVKEYIYLFASGGKIHPFCAPLMTSTEYELDIDLMQQGAKLFEGEHSFACYCTKPNAETKFIRKIEFSAVESNDVYSANFFPDESYLFKVRSGGFLRYQVRWMMGALFALGGGRIDLNAIRESLSSEENTPIAGIAPASGLILNSIDFGFGEV